MPQAEVFSDAALPSPGKERAVRLVLIVLAGSVAFSGCSNAPASTSTSTSTASPARSDGKNSCAGFGVAQAAELMGVPASEVKENLGSVTPTTRSCDFVAGDKRIGFTVTVEESVDAARRVLENAKETYEMALRVQEKATGKEIPEGAWSDILNIEDEVIWSVTNGTILGRRKNVTYQVMFPNDKRGQAAVAQKIAEGI
jgi:hypothetical protein